MACVRFVCCYSEKDYTDAVSDDETLSGLGSVSEEIEGMTVGILLYQLHPENVVVNKPQGKPLS